jgi:hypothetical protein
VPPHRRELPARLRARLRARVALPHRRELLRTALAAEPLDTLLRFGHCEDADGPVGRDRGEAIKDVDERRLRRPREPDAAARPGKRHLRTP